MGKDIDEVVFWMFLGVDGVLFDEVFVMIGDVDCYLCEMLSIIDVEWDVLCECWLEW